jgi:hypothetical protein
MEALRDGVAVARARADGFGVGALDARVGRGVVMFEPREQGRAEVEAQARVVVEYALDAPVRIEDAREGVRAVALEVDALVPIMEGARARLLLDLARPRVLARRLVEVAVDD